MPIKRGLRPKPDFGSSSVNFFEVGECAESADAISGWPDQNQMLRKAQKLSTVSFSHILNCGGNDV
jgi:urocanate hydratase